jgi:hypothetical protein
LASLATTEFEEFDPAWYANATLPIERPTSSTSGSAGRSRGERSRSFGIDSARLKKPRRTPSTVIAMPRTSRISPGWLKVNAPFELELESESQEPALRPRNWITVPRLMM